MEDIRANLSVLNDNDMDIKHFTIRLAAFCSTYVMEVAKPIMEHRTELYEDKAIVRLVCLWYDANREYEHKRRSYLVQWVDNKEGDYGFEPLDSYKWADEKRKAYRDALYALLVD